MDVMATEQRLKQGGLLTVSRLCAVAKKVHSTEYSCDFPGCTFKTRVLNHFENHRHDAKKKKVSKWASTGVSERKLSLRSATKLALAGNSAQLTGDGLTEKETKVGAGNENEMTKVDHDTLLEKKTESEDKENNVNESEKVVSALPVGKALTLYRMYKKEKEEHGKLKKEMEEARKIANGQTPTEYQMEVLAGYLTEEFLQQIRECEDEEWFDRAILFVYAKALHDSGYKNE